MNVLEVLIDVTLVQHATTRMGVTPALATMDTQAMGLLVWVSTSNIYYYDSVGKGDVLIFNIYIYI